MHEHRRPSTGKPRSRQSQVFSRKSLLCERLEDRRLLATFTVTNDADAGAGSLRQAILDANVTAVADVVQFAPSLNEAYIWLSTGELTITKPLTIDASNLPGGIEIDGRYSSRVFNIDDSNPAEIDVTLRGLTITDGRAAANGAGIRNVENLMITGCTVTNSETSSSGYFAGGGIYTSGNLTVTNSTISNNRASDGGGIHVSYGNLTLDGVTVSSNYAKSNGGGIWSASGGYQTTITNSTISGNQAIDDGGGVFNEIGPMFIFNSTITENYVFFGQGGGVASDADGLTDTTVASSILSGNVNDSDVDGIGGTFSFTSYGYNVIGGGNALANFIASDQLNVYDPGLLPLTNNGGPTKTHAPLLSSPAVDAGINLLGLTYDQRGAPFLRQDTGFPVDVGAVEWQTATFPLLVDTPIDEFDGDYSPGDLSLREAINAANGFAGLDSISFDTLGAFAPATTIELTLGQLNIASSLDVVGPGANRLSIDAQANSRVFFTYSYPFGSNVTLSGMTITGGSASGRASGRSLHGGGINNETNLTLADAVVSYNYAPGRGGGINTFSGNLLVTNTTITGNVSAFDGGGICSNTDLLTYQTTISNSTVSGNLASRSGGGLANINGRTIIENSTITRNTAPFGYGSGVASDDVSDTLTGVLSSIISDNADDSDVDLVGFTGTDSFVSNGRNLVGNGSGTGGFINNDLRYITDPQLLPLADNGGPTPTHALLITSPAIDNGINLMGLAYDQRGAPFLRQDIGFPVDIGAYEWQTAYFPLIVDTNIDELDGDYDPGDLSLREAIHAANGFVGADFISFDTLGLFADPQAIELGLGQLNISDSVTIEGPAADRLIVDALGNSRVLYIDDGQFGADIGVALSGMTITGGLITTNYDDGGGILNREQLVLSGMTISGNAAIGVYADGGGIYSSAAGNLTVTSSTISGNAATYRGGGVFTNTYAPGYVASFVNSTVSGNIADVYGGGLFNRNGLMFIQSSTITDNSAPAGQGSGVASLGNSYTLTEVASSIISGNDHNSDVDYVYGSLNSFASGGYNLLGNGNALGNFLDSDQKFVTAPGLAPLADNGGSTLTHALIPGSPAVNMGDPNFLPPPDFDQRDEPFVRVFAGRLDVGAVELIDGDFSDDGNYTCADIDSLVAEIAAGTNDLNFDLNSDLLVNQDDLTIWLAVAGAVNLPSHNPYLLGDADLSGFVDGQDFLIWNTNKFTSQAAWCSGDFNADGSIDGSDFLAWNNNKFTSSVTISWPTPDRYVAEDAASRRKSEGHPVLGLHELSEPVQGIAAPLPTKSIDSYFAELSTSHREHIKSTTFDPSSWLEVSPHAELEVQLE